MTLSINPGTGPVAGATAEHARANLDHFLTDLTNAGHTASYVATGDTPVDGRWMYVIRVDDRLWEIQMPGLPLDKVRYMAEDGQSAWNYPRLYVEGSSWLWTFALDIISRYDQDEE